MISFNEIHKCTQFLFDNNYFVFKSKSKNSFGTRSGFSLISPLFIVMVIKELETYRLNKLEKDHDCFLFYILDILMTPQCAFIKSCNRSFGYF